MDAVQSIASPLGVPTLGRGPAFLLGLKFTSRIPGGKAIQRLFGSDSLSRTITQEIVAGTASGIADEQGASPEAQILVEALAGLLGGKIFDDATTRGISQTLLNPLAVDMALQGNREDLISLLAGIGETALLSDPERLNELINGGAEDLDDPLLQKAVELIGPMPDIPTFLGFDEAGPLTQEEAEARAEFAMNNPGLENLSPAEQDNLFLRDQFRQRGISPIGSPGGFGLTGLEEFNRSLRVQLARADFAARRSERRDAVEEFTDLLEAEAQVKEKERHRRAFEAIEEGARDFLRNLGIPVVDPDQAKREAGASAIEAEMRRSFELLPSELRPPEFVTADFQARGETILKTLDAQPISEAQRRSEIALAKDVDGMTPFLLQAQEIVRAERRDQELREAEAQARAKRESAAIAARDEESLQQTMRESVRNAPSTRGAVDLIDAMHESDLKIEALRQSEAIASEEEMMFKVRRRSLEQANADRESIGSGAAIGTSVVSGPPSVLAPGRRAARVHSTGEIILR